MLWKICPECGGVANWNSDHRAFECEQCDWIEYRYNILEYKGFYASIEFDAVEKTLFGQIDNISDFVTFESESIDGIEESFHNAVEDYLYLIQDGNDES